MIIGRKQEQTIFQKMEKGSESEFVAVVGRRRVGKTYLVEEYFNQRIKFLVTATKDFSNADHLQYFENKLLKYFPDLKIRGRRTWKNLFDNLILGLESLEDDLQVMPVIFIDELPWFAKQKSGFMAALAYFWNDWGRKNKIILVVCGSAGSWMMSNIVKEKGSLYNRMTKLIHIQPFTLSETKEFLSSKGIYYNEEQILQIYMVMGGMPHYLKEVSAGLSAVQNIQYMCFSPNGILTYEYDNLYDALFDNSNDYKKIIEVLHKKRRGLTRQEIAREAKLTTNGAFYAKIEELTQCDFLMEVANFDQKSKNAVLRLVDEYSLFYHHFIKKNKMNRDDYWFSVFNTGLYNNWIGYAFENCCFRHIDKIKDALKIGGIKINVGSFYHTADNEAAGAQIDILFDRADNCINLVECKYYKDHFYLSKPEADAIKKRKAVFQHISKTKKHIFITLIAPGELIFSRESTGLIDMAIGANALFG